MNRELNFEQLQKKLKKALNPSRFRFVVILYPNTNMIDEIKEHISSIYPQSATTSLDLKDKSYQEIAPELYKNNEGFVYINDFDEILNNPDLYNGFNQRRDKIASFNINLICFISLYQKDELFTKAINVIPDLWEFKNTVLELEKDDDSDKLKDIKVSSRSYSSIGGLTTKDKKIEVKKLLERFEESASDDLKSNLLNQIATIYMDIGNLPQALIYQKKGLSLAKKNLEKNDPNLASHYNNIALINRGLGNLSDALIYQQKSIKLYKETLGENHQSIALCYNNLATLYLDMGELENALFYEQKSLSLTKKHLDETHPDFNTIYNNLSSIFYKMKHFTDALYYQEKAIKVAKESLGINHPSLALSYNNMSMVYNDMGEFQKAILFQEKALKLREKVLGEKHLDVAISYNNLAIIYQKLKEYSKAREFLKKCVKILDGLNYNYPGYENIKNSLKSIESQIQKKSKYRKDM